MEPEKKTPEEEKKPAPAAEQKDEPKPEEKPAENKPVSYTHLTLPTNSLV